MGTSTSSAGAGSGVSFDPPWLNDAEDSIDSGQSDKPISPITTPVSVPDETGTQEQDGDQATYSESGLVVAPPGRYQDARRFLTSFVRSGSSSDLKRGISSFVKKGMGGPVKAASRMRMSTVAASSLGGFLATARDATDPDINAWLASVKQRGLSAKDASLEVIQKLVPSGGSVDEESAKHAMSQAITRLYEMDSNVDIFNLSDNQIANVMAYTLAYDVYNRVQLELGRVFEKMKYAPVVIQERLAQLLDYIMVVVNRSMEKNRSGALQCSMQEIATLTLQKALTVFTES